MKRPSITIPPTTNPRRRAAMVLAIIVSLLFFNLATAPASNAGSRPGEGFQCRAVVENVGSRPGNAQIIEPIRASNRCQGNISYQSIEVILQYKVDRRWPFRDYWKKVVSRKSARRGPGSLSIHTRWNCGNPHRNDAGRVQLRVVATGYVIDWDGDPHGASTLSRNEITRDCAV